MKKYVLDLKVTANIKLNDNYVLLKFTTLNDEVLPEMLPGQFAEVRIDGSPNTFLRRPISVNYIDKSKNELWLLIQLVGVGTRKLSEKREGNTVNMVLPLGNTFSNPNPGEKILLIGGGVGTAPMLFLGQSLREKGFEPVFLLGARSSKDVLQVSDFQKNGEVLITTEDGSAGEKGYVTQHSVLIDRHFDRIYTCGPKPMMIAVAAYAKAKGIVCEASLENMMACGIGACLCCVEDTQEGHLCVCKEGPVFNIEKLKWQI
ncbi:dihydroorotate dehydrogenase electron transfer subunit [Coprobacter tertius]|uniref:Dihydroorotate dehydrogenase electron transfer subunit n=1 Tax=Coprobacter tertius TaxID=2944915 RepID=A0ABT1MI69_9BACT|nr:dihydroorotate dehydrogenase electron transfer subunit [Coprobacter tertius]MCP9612106.1 dihydroorotate dehydrogenase electron transfer subunit [Coprobacter tertius]